MPLIETLEQVRRAGRERLYPSLTNPNWLVLRKRRQLFQRWLGLLSGQNLLVLDVGGRIQPYRSLITAGRVRYVAVDPRPSPLVDLVATAEHLPLASERFDLVMCTQMLEYATDPVQAASEIHRVLRPGGVVLLSVPSLSIRDADEDRWRFWPAGIRQLLSLFPEVEVVPEGGSVAGFFRTVNMGLYGLARYSSVRIFLSYTIIPALNLIGFSLEKLLGSRNDTFAANYSALARK